jgi:uncharacterized spore protein YtfJ
VTTPDSVTPNPGGELLDRLIDALGGATRAVFGEPVERGGVTVIPLAAARMAFGGGAGKGADNAGFRGGDGGGGGGLASVRPVGYITIRDGEATYTRLGSPWAALAVPAAVGATFIAYRAVVRLTRRR